MLLRLCMRYDGNLSMEFCVGPQQPALGGCSCWQASYRGQLDLGKKKESVRKDWLGGGGKGARFGQDLFHFMCFFFFMQGVRSIGIITEQHLP